MKKNHSCKGEDIKKKKKKKDENKEKKLVIPKVNFEGYFFIKMTELFLWELLYTKYWWLCQAVASALLRNSWF